MKNYNKPSTLKNEEKNEEKNVIEKLKDTFKPIDNTEEIKAKIKEQEEKIQALKNAVNIYFVDRCKFVNIREEQSTNSLVLDVLKEGELIEPIIYNDTTEWTKVKHKGKNGYIMTKYIGVEVSTPIE